MAILRIDALNKIIRWKLRNLNIFYSHIVVISKILDGVCPYFLNFFSCVKFAKSNNILDSKQEKFTKKDKKTLSLAEKELI